MMGMAPQTVASYLNATPCLPGKLGELAVGEGDGALVRGDDVPVEPERLPDMGEGRFPVIDIGRGDLDEDIVGIRADDIEG